MSYDIIIIIIIKWWSLIWMMILRCAPNTYNYPLCELCNCNPSGVSQTFISLICHKYITWIWICHIFLWSCAGIFHMCHSLPYHLNSISYISLYYITFLYHAYSIGYCVVYSILLGERQLLGPWWMWECSWRSLFASSSSSTSSSSSSSSSSPLSSSSPSRTKTSLSSL